MDLRMLGYGFAATTLGQAALLELSRNGPPTYQMLAECRDGYYDELSPLFNEIADFVQKSPEERLNYKIQGVKLSEFSWEVYDAAKVEFGKDLYFTVVPEKVIHDSFIMKKCKELMDSDERFTSALSLTSTIAGGLVLTGLLYPNIISDVAEGLKLTHNRLQRVYSKCVKASEVLVRKAMYVKKLSDSIFRSHMLKVITGVKLRSNRLKDQYTSIKKSCAESIDLLLNPEGEHVKIPSNLIVVRYLLVEEPPVDSTNGQTTLSTKRTKVR